MRFDSMVVYRTWMEAIEDLDDEDAGRVIKAFLRYGMDGEEPEDLPPVLNAIFKMAKRDLDEDIEMRSKNRNTAQYRLFRKGVLARDKGVCQLCGAVEKTMHVHHIKAYKDYPKERTNVDNGITLCPKCHRRVHREKR